jgi:hypothetical protein
VTQLSPNRGLVFTCPDQSAISPNAPTKFTRPSIDGLPQRGHLIAGWSPDYFDSPRPTQYLMAFQVRRTRTPVNVCGCRFPPSLVHAHIGYSRMSACAYRCSRAEFQPHNSHLHRYHRSPRVLSHPTSNAHHKDPPPAHPGRALPSFQLPNPARPPRHVEIQLPIPPPTPPGTPIHTPRPLSRRLPRVSNHNRVSSQSPYRIWMSTLSSCNVLETRSGLGNPLRSGSG